jgi:hypothetical protein
MKKRRLVINPDTRVLLKQIAIGLSVISLAGLLIAAVWFGSRIERLTLVNVEVIGGETVDLEEIESVVQSQLVGEYAGIIPRRFAWVYPHEDILNSVNAVPRVYDIEIQRDRGTMLLVTFNEYGPDGLWCASVDDDRCVFITDTAYAFDEAPQLSGGSLLRFIRLGDEPVVGQVMLEASAYASLKTLASLLEEQGLFVSHIEFDQVGDAFLSLVGGGELKVLVSAEPAQTIDNLQAILQSPDFLHIEPGNFQYIDLRFGEKIFIKEEETMPEMDIEQASSSDAENES